MNDNAMSSCRSVTSNKKKGKLAVILAVDVHYADDGSTTAGVMFDDWEASTPQSTYVSKLPTVEEYRPGLFYERELPCIVNLLREHALQPDCIVVDGYVFLDGIAKPGLGKYLFDALAGQVKIIGVAKTSFAGIGPEFMVHRGESTRALYVTCAGVDVDAAKGQVLRMHGKYRMPTLLRTVDQLCRNT